MPREFRIIPLQFLLTVCSLLLASVCRADDTSSAAEKPSRPVERKIDFKKDVQPIFANRCYECHGPDTQEAGFRLDRKVDALTGGDSGASIVPGDSESSSLYRYVSGDDPDIVMPPDGELLSDEQIKRIRLWIDQGAVWPEEADKPQSAEVTHWAYQPLVRPAPPIYSENPWVRNPIDAFVLQKLNEADVAPSPPADRNTLIRRLSIDLLGLLPAPDEVDAFVNDRSPKAYEKLVDRLLKSPHFGERWGRHWLDKARYADSDGYEKDRPRPNAWKYRDWVIDAVNNDLPFDRFTVEQLAGDQLPGAGPDTKLATAFHRQTLTNTEGGTDQEEFRVAAVFDRVETTGSVWLGLTFTCARCHSHKYDRLSQREYYRMFAFFNNGDETNTNVPISEEKVAEYSRQKAVHDKQVAALEEKIAEARSGLPERLAEWEKSTAGKGRIWNVVEPDEVSSKNGATFTKKKDGSVLAGGDNPSADTYTVRLRPGATRITGIRLESLPDEKLPSRGPGRVAHGNFVLNELRAALRTGGQAETQPVAFSRATADFAQKGYPVAEAIDGDTKTGWAVAPQFGKRHVAVFELNTPLEVSGESELILALDQQYGKQHTIGRLRFSVTTGAAPVVHDALPDDVAAVLAVEPEKRNEKQQKVLQDYYAGLDPLLAELNGELEALKKQAPKSPYMSVRVISRRAEDPRETFFLRRGDFLQPADEVQPGTPEILHEFRLGNSEGLPDRLDLARWLVGPENSLTPRVTANHVWGYLFGRGLVTTPGDFGVRGEPPTHPELLDWLATEYRRLGWSRKALIKTIVMSSTYRQSSAHRPKLVTTDPQNRLLHRQNRFRVEAEIIRDLSLAASSLLSRKIGGPSVFPPMSKDVAELSYANNFKWNSSKGADRHRRGMYTFFKRTAPHPNLVAFDCPDSNLTCIDRNTSNTPLQALITMNNEVYVEACQALARRVLTAPAEDDAGRVTLAFRCCLTRKPSTEERAALLDLLSSSREWYESHPEDAKKLVGKYRPAEVSVEETAPWVAVARVILNFDEFITRE